MRLTKAIRGRFKITAFICRNLVQRCPDRAEGHSPFKASCASHFYRRLFKGVDCLCSGAVARHFPLKPINLSKTSSELAVTK
jgi:hypothetical protein